MGLFYEGADEGDEGDRKQHGLQPSIRGGIGLQRRHAGLQRPVYSSSVCSSSPCSEWRCTCALQLKTKLTGAAPLMSTVSAFGQEGQLTLPAAASMYSCMHTLQAEARQQ